MQIVIAGCGRVGSTLAQTLSADGHDVTIIDRAAAPLEALGKSFNGSTVTGEAFDVDTLEKAGINSADVFLAVTDSDNANLMAVEVAKEVFEVPRSIARLYDPNREATYRALDIKFVTGTKLIAQVLYEQTVDEEFHYHVTFVEGDVEIVEFTLNESAVGLTVGSLEVRNRLRIAAVRRADHTHIPNEKFKLKPGDLIVAAARESVRPKVQRWVETVSE
jgi:trk system potassium uptake protein TrkA